MPAGPLGGRPVSFILIDEASLVKCLGKLAADAAETIKHIAAERLCCHNQAMATISEALTIAIQHHQAGRLQAAEQIYRRILRPNRITPTRSIFSA